MRIEKPDYFDQFSCLADRCPDSCCHEWILQVDEETARFYRRLPGPLGERLREVLQEEDGDIILSPVDGKCPMWRPDGLCRIQAELGHDALCQTCRQFPRLTHDYGDFVEYGLELSCPEAARLILTTPSAPLVSREVPGGEEPAYDRQDMALLQSTRDKALSLLDDPARTVAQALSDLLRFAGQVQWDLTGGSLPEPEKCCPIDEGMAAMVDFFNGMEILTNRWRRLLSHPAPGPWREEHRRLARYLIQRYWLQAISDLELLARVKFLVAACLLLRHLGSDVIAAAQLFSKEIENDADNIDAILDAAYTNPAFHTSTLLGLLEA